jgi:membrane protein implicated in regulation of membrane protease activity
MSDVGKLLVLAGLALAGVGALLWLGPKVPWLGRLPGDFSVERPNFRFYFPLTTCIIASLLLTLLAWLFRRH